jgi:hypothetical protein
VTSHVLQAIRTTHLLPLWFLVFSLLLPRVALLVFWVQQGFGPFHLRGWLAIAAGVFLPRALVLYLIYIDQGISVWFVIHAVTALVVWAASGNASSRKSQG